MPADKEAMSEALLYSDKPSLYFEALHNEEDFALNYPELSALINLPQNPRYHAEGDVWIHSMMVLDTAVNYRDKASDALGFMLSALVHDFGKAEATEEIKGIIHAYGHEKKGLPLIERFMERMHFTRSLTDYVLNMSLLHTKPNTIAADRSGLNASNRMFDAALCPEDLIYLAACDAIGQRPQGPFKENTEFLFERLGIYKQLMAEAQLCEDDFKEAGIDSPALIKEALAYAHKLCLSGVSRGSALKQSLAYIKKLNKQMEKSLH